VSKRSDQHCLSLIPWLLRALHSPVLDLYGRLQAWNGPLRYLLPDLPLFCRSRLTILNFFARCALSKALQELPFHWRSLLCTLAPQHHLLETSYRLHIAVSAKAFRCRYELVEFEGVCLQEKDQAG
jgi:hypothetical protein